MTAVSTDVYVAIRDIATAQRLPGEQRERMLRLAKYAADQAPPISDPTKAVFLSPLYLGYRWGGRRNGGAL